MNLHEECLLKYLLNPTNLFETTELLKLNNSLLEKSCKTFGSGAKITKPNTSATKL